MKIQFHGQQYGKGLAVLANLNLNVTKNMARLIKSQEHIV